MTNSPHSVLQLPEVLGQTGAAFSRNWRRLGGKGGEEGGRVRYMRFFREGLLTEVGAKGRAWSTCVQRILRTPSEEGEVIKFLLSVPGAGNRPSLETESVLIPMKGRGGRTKYTLCVSSQIGCAMGCAFCQTAQMGLLRNLTAAEIVAQWFAATHDIGIRPGNIVFMGMGEPMDNLEAVIQAIAVLTDHAGPAVPMGRIAVSTVGRVDGIRRLARQVREPGWHRLTLAVSLNAPNDAVRSSIMPVNRAMPLAAIRTELENWPIFGGATLCLEYVLIPTVNDRPEHATELAEFVRGLPAIVNVIPYNPRENSPWPAPDEASIRSFVQALADLGQPVRRRRTKGRETMAACGQLGNASLRRELVMIKTEV